MKKEDTTYKCWSPIPNYSYLDVSLYQRERNALTLGLHANLTNYTKASIEYNTNKPKMAFAAYIVGLGDLGRVI